MNTDAAVIVEGYIESISTDAVTGWVWELGADRALVVQVFFHDLLLGQAVADRYRKDLQDGGKGGGAHAFEFTFPEPLPDADARAEIRVRIEQTGRFLALTTPLVRKLAKPTTAFPMPRVSDDPPAPAPAPAPAAATQAVVAPEPAPPQPAPRARVENLGLHDTTLRGAATLEGARSALLVTIDGAKLDEITLVGDLAEYGDRLRAFSVSIPDRLMDDAEHRVAVFDAWTGQRLQGGTATLRFVPVKPPEPEISTPRPAPTTARAPLLVTTAAARPSARIALLAGLCRADGRSARLVLVGSSDAVASDAVTRSGALIAADTTAALMHAATEFARLDNCPAVLVSPPTLPNLVAALLIRQHTGCAMIVDVDEADPAFARPSAPMDVPALLAKLTAGEMSADDINGSAWTAYAQSVIDEADGLIVSNLRLRKRFGGILVRNGRAAKEVAPGAFDRVQRRAAYGYGARDRVILLHGDVQLRDGIVEIADALERLADDRLVLCVAGSIADPRIVKRLGNCTKARIDLHLSALDTQVQAQGGLELLAMADCLPVLQPATSAEVYPRIPDALTDALAMGVPVLATPAEALADLAAAGAVRIVADPAQLEAALHDLAEAVTPPSHRHDLRSVYLAEFSQEVNRARLMVALEEAARPPQGDGPATSFLLQLLQTPRLQTPGLQTPGLQTPRLQTPRLQTPRLQTPHQAQPSPTQSRAPLVRGANQRDVVFLTAGNDSPGDMSRLDAIARQWRNSDLVGKVVHFDARLSGAQLEGFASGLYGDAHQGSLVYASTVRRVLGIADTPGIVRRTFVHRTGQRAERLLGRDLPPSADYAAFMRTTLDAAGVHAHPVLFVSLGAADFAVLRQVIDPALIVADADDTTESSALSAEQDAILAEVDILFCPSEEMRARLPITRSDARIVTLAADPSHLSWPDQAAAMWRHIERDAGA